LEAKTGKKVVTALNAKSVLPESKTAKKLNQKKPKNKMKKITIVLTVLIAITIKVNAQIPANSGFELWTTVGSYENPIGIWMTGNSTATGIFYPVTKSIDHYPSNVGNYSIRIENNPSLLPGYAAYGVVTTIPAFVMTNHPNSFCGYYKYAPLNGDTMQIYIQLYKGGNNLAHATLLSTNAASAWTSFNIPITGSSYTAGAIADSGVIVLAAYNAGVDITTGTFRFPYGNSVLYVDNLSFDNLITSVPEMFAKNPLFNLYPNPASDIVTLNIANINNVDLTLNIYNVIGTLVKSEILKQNNRQINVGDLGNGVYMVTIKSKALTESQRLMIQR